jgi:hypothetical protein
MAALVGALLLWFLSAAWHTEAQAEWDDARTGAQKAAKQLSDTIDAKHARAERAKRFALIKTVLENNSPEKAEWEQLLARQLSEHPHLTEPTLATQPALPAFSTPEHLPAITLQQLQVEVGLLHEEALLALDAIVASSPAHVISTGCSLRRETDVAPITLHARCGFDWISLAASPESDQ